MDEHLLANRIKELAARAEEEYGSFYGYLFDGLNISKEEHERLKELYLV